VPVDPHAPDAETDARHTAAVGGGEAAGAPASPPGWSGGQPGAVPYPYPPYPPPWEEEVDLREYRRVLVRNKRMILTATLAAAVIAAIISLIIPKTYTATARILPPKDQSSGGLAAALSGQLGGVAALAAGALGGSLGGATNAELLVGMLLSRAVTDRILDRFNLQEVYDTKYRVEAREELLDNLDTSVSKKSGIITLSVNAHDPERAAAMANAFVHELDRLSRHLNLTEASRKRVFLEERLVQVNKDLASAEDTLRAFQEKYGAIQVEEQAKSMIDLLGTLKGQLMAAQVELGVTRRFASGNNPEVDRLQTQIHEIESRIRDLEQGKGERPSGDIFLPTQEVPELGVRYVRLLRDVKVQESIYELLTKQYEMAKMQEARDAPTIQVLDKAVVPEKKSKPKRVLIVVLTAIMGLLGASIVALIHEGGGEAAPPNEVQPQ